MRSQSIPFRPLWALQTTSAKHRVLQWLLLARFTTHTILLQLRLLVPCLSSRVVASWLTLRICWVARCALCSRMRRSGPTKWTTWLARVSGSLARSMAASACRRALAERARTHAQQHTPCFAMAPHPPNRVSCDIPCAPSLPNTTFLRCAVFFERRPRNTTFLK